MGGENSVSPEGGRSGASPLRVGLKAPLALLPPEKDGDLAGVEVDAAAPTTTTTAAAESVAVRAFIRIYFVHVHTSE